MDTAFDFEQLQAIVKNLPATLRDKMTLFIRYHESRIRTFPGSIKYHHRETGGWLRHVLEVYEFALAIQQSVWLATAATIPLPLPSDIFLAAFLHDFAKLYSYYEDPQSETGFSKTPHRWQYINPEVWTIREAALFGIPLSDAVVNAVLMAEGGWSAFARESTHSNPSGGDSLPLAVLIHAADMVSAKILGEYQNAGPIFDE